VPASRDGSIFPFGHFSGAIRLWRNDHDAGGGRVASGAFQPAGKASRSVAALFHLWPAKPFRRSFPTDSTTKVSWDDPPETRVQIRRYFYAEHWKIGTIAQALNVHPDTVRRAIEQEAFLRLQVFPAEQAQVDWAYFGSVMVGRAKRQLSCFVMTLSWSRALYLEFFFDQTTENFLRGHVRAFQDWSGAPRVILYDNLKSAVLERRGNQIHFNPRLLELAADYHFAPRPCQVRAGNQKGRVERAIRYVRDSFWAGRVFTTLAECNRQALAWRDEVAHQRHWPDDSARSVAQAFAEEQPRLLPLPLHPFNTDRIEPVRSRKTIYVHFDLNDYSIPPEAVGRPLTLAASDTEVRILDGAAEIARHPRSYDRQKSILDPAHQEALLRTKRKALHQTRAGRLALTVPESEDLLERAFAQGESAATQTSQLLRLLDLYGVAALRRAIREALERNTPRASSVAFLLRRHQRSAPLPALDLSRHPEAQALDVRPHDLETYDELAHPHDDESEQ